ncbi:hypothetical protein GCM10011428_59170 [Streptomyces violaceus]
MSDLSAYADFADQINPSYGSLSTEYVSAVQEFDGPHGTPLEVFTWTVDDAATAQRVARYGVDGIITNKPDVVREAVGGCDPSPRRPADGSRLPAFPRRRCQWRVVRCAHGQPWAG